MNKPVVETILLRMMDKLESLDDRLSNVDKQLAVYNEQLQQHMKRTDVSEERLEAFAASLDVYKSDRKKLEALMWIGGIITSFAAFALVLKELLFTK